MYAADGLIGGDQSKPLLREHDQSKLASQLSHCIAIYNR